jgi:hypothetical protein
MFRKNILSQVFFTLSEEALYSPNRLSQPTERRNLEDGIISSHCPESRKCNSQNFVGSFSGKRDLGVNRRTPDVTVAVGLVFLHVHY